MEDLGNFKCLVNNTNDISLSLLPTKYYAVCVCVVIVISNTKDSTSPELLHSNRNKGEKELDLRES